MTAEEFLTKSLIQSMEGARSDTPARGGPMSLESTRWQVLQFVSNNCFPTAMEASSVGISCEKLDKLNNANTADRRMDLSERWRFIVMSSEVRFETGGTNLLSECIFSNLFALQAGFFARNAAVFAQNYLVAKVATERI
jgi:hypothetical protein